MEYPQRLLPHPRFKKIEVDLDHYCLCRKVPDVTILQEPLEEIADEILGIESASDCFDYSTNLPGILELDDNRIELIGSEKAYFRTYWDFRSVVKIPMENVDFIINEAIGSFFLPIGPINGYKIPFNRKEKAALEKAEAEVVHTPSNSNFWHFSIKWKDANGYISRTDSKWKNAIISAVRTFLSEHILLHCDEQSIEVEWYLN